MNRRNLLAGLATLLFVDDEIDLDDVLYSIPPSETPVITGWDLAKPGSERTVYWYASNGRFFVFDGETTTELPA